MAELQLRNLDNLRLLQLLLFVNKQQKKKMKEKLIKINNP